MKECILFIVVLFLLVSFFLLGYNQGYKQAKKGLQSVKPDKYNYYSDLDMLEILTGKKIPEDSRKALDTPTGHELVSWILDHLER